MVKRINSSLPRRRLTLSTYRLSRKKSFIKRRREKRMQLLNSLQADHQYCIRPQPDIIENTNLNVNMENVHYLDPSKKKEIGNNHDHSDINNHYDFVIDIKEEIEIKEEAIHETDYYGYNEDNHDSNDHYDIDKHDNIEEIEIFKKEYDSNTEYYESRKDNNCDSHDNKEEIKVYQEEDIHNGNIEHYEDYEDLIIDNKQPMNTSCINIPKGRYIVDIFFIFNEIHRTFENHAQGIGCHFKDWKLVHSHSHGLLTQFVFKCQMCNYEDSIWSEPIETEGSVSSTLDINAAAVTGATKAGIGFSQLKELCTSMNIVCMSDKTYKEISEKFS